MAGRARARAAAFGALAALLLVGGAVAGEACPYPLGDHLLTGDVLAHGGSPRDPADQLTDTVWIGTQLSPGQFAAGGGFVHFGFESETDFVIANSTQETEAHVIAYRAFSARTGWNVRPEFVSSADPSVPAPVGDHTSPAMVADGEHVWMAWQVSGPSSGDPAYPDSGSYLLGRERTAAGWGAIFLLSPGAPTSRASLPDGALVDGAPLFVYQTNRLAADSQEFHIASQGVSGGSASAPVNVSTPDDGWSDEGVALASDGRAAAAVWSARNVSDVFAHGGSEVRLSVRAPSGAWSAPVRISAPGQDGIDKPAVAFHNGRIFVAWTARDFAVAPRGDTSLFLRSLDPSTGILYDPVALTNDSHRGDELTPAMVSFNGSLHLVWGSTSAADGSGSTWQVSRTFTCTLGLDAKCPITLVDRPDDELYADLWPGLFVADGALIVSYGLNFGNFVGTAANQHTVTRVLERGPWALDALAAAYGADAALPGRDGTARLSVRLTGPGGSPASSDHFALRFPDGAVMRLPAGFSSGDFQVPYRDGAFEAPVEALWCGQPIPLSTFALAPAPGSGLGAAGAAAGLAAAVLAAAAIVVLARRAAGGSPGAPHPADRSASEEE